MGADEGTSKYSVVVHCYSRRVLIEGWRPQTILIHAITSHNTISGSCLGLIIVEIKVISHFNA